MCLHLERPKAVLIYVPTIPTDSLSLADGGDVIGGGGGIEDCQNALLKATRMLTLELCILLLRHHHILPA